MSTELTVLAWTILLALVQIFLPALFRTRETGAGYNVGPRDTPGPPVGLLTARLQRAQANLMETLPLFAAAVLAVHVAGRESTHTAWGAWLYFGARVAYVPLYAFGVPVVRTLAFAVSIAGLLRLVTALL